MVLAVDTEENLENVVRTLLTAYGFNINVGRFRYPDDVSQKYVWTYEIGPSNDDGKTNQCHTNYIFNEKQIIGKPEIHLQSSSHLSWFRYTNMQK